ncbi:unnamed protein product [Meloidogyne enterolobii]|uniref:Uncharacterized protein n=1 Tax=Meloidogyne enterolobii TaxID=390850 RepID=A0ACB1A881_MELEN
MGQARKITTEYLVVILWGRPRNFEFENLKGISISTPGCDFIGIIAHEIGHALGTFHEQARPDQSRHIAIHYK